MYTQKNVSDPVGILENLFLFQGVEVRSLDRRCSFLSNCKFCTFAGGEIMQSTGKSIDAIAVITDGKASVLSDASAQGVYLRSLQTGDVFGAAGIYKYTQQYSTVIRADRDCTVFTLPAKDVQNLITCSSVIAENYIRFLSDRICFLNKKISVFTAGTAEARLAMYLLSLPVQEDGTRVIPVRMSDVASSLNIGRASLYRALDTLEENHFLKKIDKNRYQCDTVALQQLLR